MAKYKTPSIEKAEQISPERDLPADIIRTPQGLFLKSTLNGIQNVWYGDWLLTDFGGRKYLMADDEFRKRYQLKKGRYEKR